MCLAHRQFGHQILATVTSAFPLNIFSLTDISTHTDIGNTCVPRQAYAQLPRCPRYALPPRPLVFNHIIATEVFHLTHALPMVLDMTCTHIEYGLGRFVSSIRGDIIFCLLFFVSFCIHDSPETVVFDRGPVNETAAVINGLHSIGVHWGAAPTEAPWSIGRNERHRGRVRAAYLRIAHDTPGLAPELALAMNYKACNDAPRARGVASSTVVTGEPPRLILGDNTHATRPLPRAPPPCRLPAPNWSSTRPPNPTRRPVPPRHHRGLCRGGPTGLVPPGAPRVAARHGHQHRRQECPRAAGRQELMRSRFVHQAVSHPPAHLPCTPATRPHPHTSSSPTPSRATLC